ncbi:Uncharacterized protein family (UPF0259) [Beggiatoa alba B18LD]|uniref:Uncharacterized protein family (UPF0259) n=1 Tax=Beggiatoa alba B18LD TaxID=395493 RepID=I3CHF5_9GAMM|nr:hypothetical protein [Beggiatoa alba]EIJ43048.1 Uncharacterized protein family (UPF0259) [Beggiatoa alba B18LD]
MLPLSTTPQTPNQLLENGIRLFIQAFPTTYPVALAVGILSMLPSLSSAAFSSENLDDVMQAMLDFTPYMPFYMGIMLVLYSILFYQLSTVIRGIQVSYREIVRASIEKLPVLFMATWIYAFILSLGFFFMVIPGIILGIALIFYIPLILFEDKGIFSGLRQSFQLVWGRWFHTALVLLLAFFMSSVLGQLLLMLLEALLYLIMPIEETSLLAILKFAYGLINALLSPFLDGVILLLLYDLKLRQAITQPTVNHIDTPKNGHFDA